MIRRIHTPVLLEGETALDPVQAHHARAVLRLCDGDEVEVFDNSGRTAAGVLRFQGAQDAAVWVEQVAAPSPARTGPSWSVASAVPKGERSDWMVEPEALSCLKGKTSASAGPGSRPSRPSNPGGEA